jgi:hypothetical protein
VSERTKASLKVARARGKVFGGRNAQSDANAADAVAFAETLLPVIDEIRSSPRTDRTCPRT